eukprot:scaffold5960_cov63-Phaeocystis_antarctica.AAC.2
MLRSSKGMVGRIPSAPPLPRDAEARAERGGGWAAGAVPVSGVRGMWSRRFALYSRRVNQHATILHRFTIGR